MKRSLEYESSDLESATEEHSQEPNENFCSQEFIPTTIEKQVVRSALALIRRSNMYDWDIDNSTDTTKYMTLKENVIIKDLDFTNIYCDLIVNISFEFETTNCTIEYTILNEPQMINMSWESSPYGNFLFTLEKGVQERSYLVFTRTNYVVYEIFVRDEPDLYWCYFPDVRYHLERIST